MLAIPVVLLPLAWRAWSGTGDGTNLGLPSRRPSFTLALEEALESDPMHQKTANFSCLSKCTT